MKTFTVCWTETLNRQQKIKAESLENAYMIAENKYIDRELLLGDDDFVSVEIMAVDPETGESIINEIE